MKLLNVVVFAQNYQELISWYKNTFQLETLYEVSEGYNYTELGFDGKIMIGITPATEVGGEKSENHQNSLVMQLEVDNIKEVLKNVEDNNGKTLFGPSYEEKHGFYYGGVSDLEGNQIWLVEKNKEKKDPV